MAEYIDKEKLPKRKEYWDDDFGAGYDACLDDIDKVPAADVVPVVRCKNCVFYQKDPEIAKAMNLEPEIYCAVNRIEMGPDAFCSYGRTTPWLKVPAKEVDND